MIGLLLWGLGLAIWAAVVAGLIYVAYWGFFKEPDYIDGRKTHVVVGIAAVLVIAVITIVPLAFLSGEITFASLPEGCYRVSSTTSTSVAIVPGKVTTVVPIVTSGRVYTPIACPS